MEDRIAKQKLNIILLVDTSKSMGGTRIKQVDKAIADIKDYLVNLESENSNVDFMITIIPFNNFASFYDGKDCIPVGSLSYKGLSTGGWSNLHTGYEKLGEIMRKASKGGIMPDFGGATPIVLLLTDGHPTGDAYKEELAKLETLPWFKVALRYGVAIELDDQRTLRVLHEFVGNNGEVITCYDAKLLQNIIKIIVLTASKVQSQNSAVKQNGPVSGVGNIQQQIGEALADAASWEW